MTLADVDWLDLFRVVMFIGTWSIIPINLWTYYKVRNQLQAWQDAEDARVIRWRADLAASAKVLAECTELRHLAEVHLAMARRQSMDRAPGTPE